jgi:drug/metabolite transporter (DMT)-like permease
VFYQLLFSIPLFALGAPMWDAAMVLRVNLEIVAAIVFQALITTAFAFVAWTRLMQIYGAVALQSVCLFDPGVRRVLWRALFWANRSRR